MSSVKLPLDMPSLEDTSDGSVNLSKRIQAFCQEQKVKRIYQWESLKLALERMKKSKEKCCEQQAQEEKDAACAQMVQNLEKTRAIVRNSVSRASTISADKHQLTLTEDDFLAIQRKMDKIDQRLDELYKNWHAEYRDAVSTEDCKEIKRSSTNFLCNRIDFFSEYKLSPVTDMASSSVREIIILAITPTLDGVCGMLLYIILNFVFGQIE